MLLVLRVVMSEHHLATPRVQVGVGCFVDSCRTCPNCRLGDEQYCLGDGKGGAVRTMGRILCPHTVHALMHQYVEQ
jgi:Zn-dependent alcohol dehydrogenase